ncbi:hypothetical protein ES703_15013 [subsurface metagenome]
MEHGGPVVCYRTAHEIRGEDDLENPRDDLLSSKLVVRWLSLLQPGFRNWKRAKSSYCNSYEFVAPLETE